MGKIVFTQYVRPNGRQVQDEVERPDEIVALANKIIEKGYKFTAEDLGTGMYCFTVEGPLPKGITGEPDETGDIEIELVRSDAPEKVLAGIDTMIKRAAKRLGI